MSLGIVHGSASSQHIAAGDLPEENPGRRPFPHSPPVSSPRAWPSRIQGEKTITSVKVMPHPFASQFRITPSPTSMVAK